MLQPHVFCRRERGKADPTPTVICSGEEEYMRGKCTSSVTFPVSRHLGHVQNMHVSCLAMLLCEFCCKLVKKTLLERKKTDFSDYQTRSVNGDKYFDKPAVYEGKKCHLTDSRSKAFTVMILQWTCHSKQSLRHTVPVVHCWKNHSQLLLVGLKMQ